jgi:TrmH family RNA methyltransferase
MLTKNKIKFIQSLKNKKARNEEGLFVVEGEKNILELLNSDYKIEDIFCTKAFYTQNMRVFENVGIKPLVVEVGEVASISHLEANDTGVAVVYQKTNSEPLINTGEVVIALDDIRDPGNLGTIIRIADWYGVRNIVASNDTVDVYNSKVIAGSMGSFTRVNIYYTDLSEYLAKIKTPILGAYLDGENVHNYKFPASGILLMGNESNGISEKLKPLITNKITIPRHGLAESLNVANATAVILDNWRR